MGGFSGVLAGLGAGLKSYGQSMQETEKMNWLAKQDEVKFERERNLEDLRASRAAKENQLNRDATKDNMLAGQEFTAEQNESMRTHADQRWREEKTFQADQSKANNARADGRIAEEHAWQIGREVVAFDKNGIKITREEFNKMTPEQQNTLRSPEDKALADDLAKQGALIDQAATKAQEQRVAAADRLRAMDAKDGKTDPYMSFQADCIENGVKPSDIIGEGKPMTPEGFKAISEFMATQGDDWDERPFDEKVSIIKDVGAIALGSGVTRKVPGQATQTPKMPVDQAKTLASKGSVTAEQVDAAVSRGTYTQQEAAEIKAMIPTADKGESAGALSGPQPNPGNVEATRVSGKPGRQLYDFFDRVSAENAARGNNRPTGRNR